jgi:Flp pilus assembly pilin Flp
MATTLHMATRVAGATAILEVTTMNTLSRFIRDDSGADLVEYALIIGLVSLAAVTAAKPVLLDGIDALFQALKTKLSAAIPTT